MNTIMDILRLLIPLFEPLGLVWLAQLVFALLFILRRRWLGSLALLLSAAILSLIGGGTLARNLVSQLEKPYVRASRLDAPLGDAVLVLGGGFRPSQHDYLGIELGDASDRLFTGIEVARLRKPKSLVVSGGFATISGQTINPSVIVSGLLPGWVVPDTQILHLRPCRNTRDEAEAMLDLCKTQKWQRIILVTSAYHMKRAEAVFKNVGLPVVPMACDFQVEGVSTRARWFNPVPRLENLYLLGLYMHEVMGWRAYQWQGWLTPPVAVKTSDALPAGAASR